MPSPIIIYFHKVSTTYILQMSKSHEFKVAGISYNQDAANTVAQSDMVEIVKEEKDALRIQTEDGKKLGYVPKEQKAWVQPFLSGSYNCVVSKRIDWRNDEGNQQVALRLTISTQ